MASSDNYMSRFSPESHFFTTPASMTQDESQAFGPVSEDQFRLTSKFSTPGSKAFAICKGVVLVQPQTGDNNKVNVILRPFTQPITGLNIKYFIYRGLDKDNFFDGDNVIIPGSSSSDFVKKINASFEAFHKRINPEKPVPIFLSKYIGFDPAKQEESLMLSNFFFKESEYVDSNGEFIEQEDMAFELPVIEMGASLGNFSSGECGIDIVLNYGDYTLPAPNDEFVFDLKYARANEAVIKLLPEMSDFQKKQKREHIFQFLDAAAYFGFHTDNGVVKIDNAGVKVSKKGLSIYNEVIHNFYTKNKLYLYIQSDRTRSYNFYDNYTIAESNGKSLKLGATEASVVESAYKNKKWPLIINDAVQVHSETRNKLFLQFVTDNNVNTMLYGQVAQIDNAQHNNFCNADDLKLPDSVDGIPSKLTKIIQLSTPAVSQPGGKSNVATFNILLYQGKGYRYVVGQAPDRWTEEMKDATIPSEWMDDVFDLINSSALLKSKDNESYSLISSQRIKLVNHYYNRTQLGIYAVQTVIVEDSIDTNLADTPMLKRVSYMTETVGVLEYSTSPLRTVIADTRSNASSSVAVAGQRTYALTDPFYFSNVAFTDQGQTINGIELKANNAVPAKKIIGITKGENEQLKELSGTSVDNPRIVFLKDAVEGDYYTSAEGIKYFKYKLGIVKENTEGKMILSAPVPEITVYSLDHNYFCSRKYSEYMIAEPAGVKGDIDNDEIKISIV